VHEKDPFYFQVYFSQDFGPGEIDIRVNSGETWYLFPTELSESDAYASLFRSAMVPAVHLQNASLESLGERF
jgi:hypothetical protein